MMTPEQKQVHDLITSGHNIEQAANALGISYQSARGLWRRAKKWANADPGIQNALRDTGIRPENARFGYRRVQDEEGNFNTVFWRMGESEREDFIDSVRDAFNGIAAATKIAAPKQVMERLCTVYPLMDVHFGMLAWGDETGDDDYDMKHATADMRHAFAKVAALTPDSREAVLLIGGDFFHADDNRAETPQSKNRLDVDGRHFKVLDCGVQLVAEVIETLLHKHEKITVRVLRGNHDEHAHMVLTFALGERYRKEARAVVEKTPRDLFMKQWGKSLISAHHGDKARPEKLTLYLSDVCPFWSETRHRFCFTGHTHHDKALDTGPLKWESLRAFCPPDAYAAGMGYASRRALQAITFHDNDGLVLRAIDPIERIAAS